MSSDNNFSSFLLLILLGLSIYLIWNSNYNNNDKQNYNSVYPIEPFNEVTMNPSIIKNNQYNLQSDSQSGSQNPSIFSQSGSQNIQDTPVSHSVQQYLPSVAQNVQDLPVSHSVQQYLPSNSQNVQLPSVTQNNIGTKLNNTNSPSIFDFAPNDESIFESDGCSLNDAFVPPMPAGSLTGTIDFKKQNTDNYDAKDFLPHEINDEWFETDFSLAKYQLNDDKLINTDRYIIGINTVGQSLKNASYDIRGTIPNPKSIISPWNNSTYEPDFNLKPLC